MENETRLVLDVNENPKKIKDWILFAIQHILAMLVACITVPFLTGLPVAPTLISAGIGTLCYILFTKKKSPVLHQPKYSEVFTTLSTNEIHKCFIAYEVLCTHANKFTDIMATKYLKHVASSHLWDYDTFIDIIDEEYDCTYNK